jgi:beta-galactosidase
MSQAHEATEEKLVFPDGFLWGSATASYQVEGSVAIGGRTPSIWDTFCEIKGKVKDSSSGFSACDHYVRFKEDVALIKSLGLDVYRFSISWSRLLPKARGEVNKEGAAFYNALIDELVAAGIKPFVTLYHWDLPQCLEDEYGGWLSPEICTDFEEYAAVCFTLFGDRVKQWLTLNEPCITAVLGYSNGEHAPGLSDSKGTKTYLAAHHHLLAHGRAYRRYHRDFAPTQGGVVGITLNCDWREPMTLTPSNQEVSWRALEWSLGWFAEPVFGSGDYPVVMRERCGERLPAFSESEKEMLRGSSDFFGLNHYSTQYIMVDVKRRPSVTLSMWGKRQSGGWYNDQALDGALHHRPDRLWTFTEMDWPVVPWGLHHLLLHIQKTYQPVGGIMITENGCGYREESQAAAEDDMPRVNYFAMYISQVHRAIEDGADVRGYIAWSLLDNFEWGYGYTKRFGIVRVDYETQKRTPKKSAQFLSKVARSNVLAVSPATLLNARFTEPLGPFVPIQIDSTYVFEGNHFMRSVPFGFPQGGKEPSVTIKFADVGNAVLCKAVRPSVGYHGEFHQAKIVDNTCVITFDSSSGGWTGVGGVIEIQHSGSSITSTGVIITGSGIMVKLWDNPHLIEDPWPVEEKEPPPLPSPRDLPLTPITPRRRWKQRFVRMFTCGKGQRAGGGPSFGLIKV